MYLNNFETEYINKYWWILLFVFLCFLVISIIANFRKNTEDLMFYLEFLIGGDMTSLLSKLYLKSINDLLLLVSFETIKTFST